MERGYTQSSNAHKLPCCVAALGGRLYPPFAASRERLPLSIGRLPIRRTGTSQPTRRGAALPRRLAGGIREPHGVVFKRFQRFSSRLFLRRNAHGVVALRGTRSPPPFRVRLLCWRARLGR